MINRVDICVSTQMQVNQYVRNVSWLVRANKIFFLKNQLNSLAIVNAPFTICSGNFPLAVSTREGNVIYRMLTSSIKEQSKSRKILAITIKIVQFSIFPFIIESHYIIF